MNIAKTYPNNKYPKKIDLYKNDELIKINTVEKITRSRIQIESIILNNYIYIHSDETRLMSARRTFRGFNIYDLRTNKFLCQLKANIFGTRYIMNKKECIGTHIDTENNIDDEDAIVEEMHCCKFEQLFSENENSPDVQLDEISPKSVKECLPSLEVIYDVKFLKRDKPRCFTVKLGELELQNKRPIYNPETNSYSLNFNGRVTIASVKNFQIVHPLEPTFITLTFGKEGVDTYILDFTHPWSALQAFCIGLSALDHKLGFE